MKAKTYTEKEFISIVKKLMGDDNKDSTLILGYGAYCKLSDYDDNGNKIQGTK